MAAVPLRPKRRGLIFAGSRGSASQLLHPLSSPRVGAPLPREPHGRYGSGVEATRAYQASGRTEQHLASSIRDGRGEEGIGEMNGAMSPRLAKDWSAGSVYRDWKQLNAPWRLRCDRGRRCRSSPARTSRNHTGLPPLSPLAPGRAAPARA